MDFFFGSVFIVFNFFGLGGGVAKLVSYSLDLEIQRGNQLTIFCFRIFHGKLNSKLTMEEW